MAKRSYQPREWKLVYEYMIKTFPNCLQWRRVRVGPIPKNQSMYGVIRRWADGIVYCPSEDQVYIIEGKMKPDPGAISQLELYRELFPKTPEFSMFKDKPIKLVFLTTILDKDLQKLARSKGIEYVVYKAKWIEEYWKERIEKYGKR
ncbi:hypothetical protein J7L13_03300 [bacterium]|nr:hypothetical protein [bacterium]